MTQTTYERVRERIAAELPEDEPDHVPQWVIEVTVEIARATLLAELAGKMPKRKTMDEIFGYTIYNMALADVRAALGLPDK